MRRLGRLVTRRRWWVVTLALAFVPLAWLAGSSVDQHLSAGGIDDPGAASSRAAALLERDFSTGEPNLLLLVTARTGSIDDPAVAAAGLALTRRLSTEPGVLQASSYWSLGAAPPLRGRDGRQALVTARIRGDEDTVSHVVAGLAPRYGSDGPLLAVQVGGQAEVDRQIRLVAKHDVGRAESISFPITLLRLVLVFGSVAAAGLPLAVGAVAVVGTLGVLRLITAVTQVSTFALNLTTAMGLALAIDYSLFVVSRYREELRTGGSPELAVVRTLQTAGRTVIFSAFTVGVSLASLLVLPLGYLRSFAYAGIGVVALAALGATVVLPAMLAILGENVEWGRLWRPRVKAVTQGFWYRRARAVMRRPVPVIVLVVGMLVVLGLPFRGIQLGLSDARVLPTGTPVRDVGEAIRTNFATGGTSTLAVVASCTGDPAARGAAIDAYATALSRIPGVSRVDALTGVYSAGRRVRASDMGSRRFGAPDATWLSVVPSVEPLSPAAEAVVRAVRSADAPFPVLVGGATAQLVDTRAAVLDRLPLAFALVAVTTFLLLFLMVGSIVVPLKALALNVLSLSATFGTLVWVFQDGHLSDLLGFTATGTIAVTTPMLLFCVAFGLSMDYEVFLLSRIKEEYDLGGDNEEAVAVGLERTGRIVTAAAVLLALVYLAFATSGVSVVKVLGIGLALAVLVDAFLIRLTLVPAFMRLLGRANWWAPRSIRRLHLRFGIWEADPLPVLDIPGVNRAPGRGSAQGPK